MPEPNSVIALFAEGQLELYSPNQPIKKGVIKFPKSHQTYGRAASLYSSSEAFVLSYSSSIPCISLFDLTTFQFSKDIDNTYELPVPRVGMAIPSENKGPFFCCGGLSDRGKALDAADCLNVLPYQERGDPFSALPDMRHKRAYACAVNYDDEKVLVIGGQSGESGEEKELDSCEMYDLIEEKWRSAARMNECRSMAAACRGDRADVIVSGGCEYVSTRGFDDDLKRVTAACEKYSFEYNEWTRIGDLNEARAGHQMVYFQDRVYAIGGRDNRGNTLRTVESYNSRSDEWEYEKLETKLDHYDFGALVIDDAKMPKSSACVIL